MSYYSPVPQQPQPPQPPQRRQTGPKWLPIAAGIIGGFILLFGLVGAIAGSGDPVASPAPAATTQAPKPTTPAPKPTTQAPAPKSKPTTKAPAPKPTKTEAPKPKKTEAPKPPKAKEVSKRQWAKVVKNPDKYAGERYIIYGEVTQFDSATGDSAFLADTAHKNTTSYGYFDGENTYMEGDASKLEDLVEDDVFKATVTVEGAYSYDTQIGGNTTVPQLTVDKIKVIDNNG